MKYTDIDFVGLTKILRAHATQIVPPGMRELKNVYISRSDNAVTLRPDFMQDILNMPSLSADLQGANYPEFLTGIYRALDIDGYIYFSNLGVLAYENTERADLPTKYRAGTITTGGDRAIVNGLDTEWLENVWAGCLIREKDTDDWYVISAVQSNTYIETDVAMPALDGAAYEILRTHPMANGAWPIQFEKLGDLLVYNAAKPTLPVDRLRVTGPFYSDTGKLDLFGGVWREDEPPVKSISGDWTSVLAWPGLFVGGENGICASSDQWVGDYDSTNKYWLIERDKYFYLDELGRLAYPRGNGYPVTDIFQLIATAADSDIVGLSTTTFGLFFAAFENGTYICFQIDSVDGDVIHNRTEEELTTLGPWMPTTISPPKPFLNPPGLGCWYQFMFGANGQIGYMAPSGSLDGLFTTNTLEDIYGGAGGKRLFLYDVGWNFHTGSRTWFFCGSNGMIVGYLGTTSSGSDNFAPLDAYYYNSGDYDLYDITYLDSLDEGAYGIGTWIAVGSYGTIIFSDDGGYTWESAYSGTDLHLNKVLVDGRNHSGSPRNARCAIAVGDAGTLLLTTDAETWTQQDITDEDIVDADFDEQRGDFIFCLPEGDPIRVKRRYQYGTGGAVIAKRKGIITANPNSAVLSVIWTGSLFVAAGTSTYTSPDGVTWTGNTPSYAAGIGKGIACLAHNDAGVVVGVGGGGHIIRSADHGLTWTNIYAVDANPIIEGNILSVIWDGSNFFCCGDKSILISADGITWADDTSFDYLQEPMLLAYRGRYYAVDYSLPTGLEEVPDPIPTGYNTVPGGNLCVLCKSGAWYTKSNDYEDTVPPNYEPDWTRLGYDDYIDPSTSELVTPRKIPEMFPAGFVGLPYGSQGSRCAATSADPVIQQFWASDGQEASSVIGSHVIHNHLVGRVSAGDVGDQEPGVLRGPIGDGTDTTPTTSNPPSFNNLLLYAGTLLKEYSNNLMLWLHGDKLLMSNDNGQTWSKGRSVIIPTSNDRYITPQPGQSTAGRSIKNKILSINGLSLASNPMVAVGEDAYMVSHYTPEGVVFLDLSWDGIQVVLGNPDLPSDVVPETVNLTSNTTETIVFTPNNASVS